MSCATRTGRSYSLSTFRADITVPLGHGMMGGAWLSKSIADPLEALGFVLLGGGKPLVWVTLDWCELRNDAYFAWQEALARAAGTDAERVVITTVHQHDAPVADLTAEKLLRDAGVVGTVCDPVFHQEAIRRTAEKLRESMRSPVRITHVGCGSALAERLVSNRKYVLPDGQIRWDRGSATRNILAIEADEGVVDTRLRTLSFWNGERPVAALSVFAVHPMSYYGQGNVSADFPGMARRARALELPGVHQIYVSGCSGNVTAGKYNTGDPGNRPVLADRLRTAMQAAWDNTRRFPLERLVFRSEPLELTPRSSPGFSSVELERKLVAGPRPFDRCLAAMGLSWRERVRRAIPLRVPCLDFGSAVLAVLPGESYVEYQLAAQRLRPDDFVLVAGYGDGATGYVPLDAHFEAGDTNLGDWCWVEPGSEARMMHALQVALN